MGIQKVAHVELGVDDVEATLEFHEHVLGLHEMAREDGVVYLGAGADEDYDLALSEGRGIRHLGLEVTSTEDLDHYAGRLAELGVSSARSQDAEPGQSDALRFTAPSGHSIELVVSAGRRLYLQPAGGPHARLKGIAPLDLDHVTLRAQDVKGLVEFLVQALDFRLSDSFQPAPGVWGAAWTRTSDFHHDVAIIGSPDASESLDHVAWTMDGIDHLKRAADQLARVKVPLEAGPGRHNLGGNLYTYFIAPGGHRYELSGEMPRIAAPDDARVWEDFPTAYSAWGAMPPESFQHGS
ncbi:MAG: glyoxalase/bleomycin resistance protein/dihydroxybiphenyl dioxygenase [Conexibacter sp.]|nr:glyoxalase/bleomycin resistance protein/dihydroxybiphenyl dioxygenase [Conexibacter sp.]